MKYIMFFILCLEIWGVATAHANIITFYFDAQGDLEDSVYGFQFQYSLSDGSLLSDDDLVIHYTQKYINNSVEPGDGAVPGTDFSALGMDPNTDWRIGIVNNEAQGGTNNILGYTLGDEPLHSGILFDVNIPDGVELSIIKVVLSNVDGKPGFFNNKFRFHRDDGHCYVNPQRNAVPLPPSAIMLMAGLIGVATIRRKNRSK